MVTALEAKEKRKKELMEIPGVVGTGVGRSSPERVNVYVEKLTSEIKKKIPKTLDNVPTQIIETGGPFKSLQLLESAEIPKALEEDRTKKWRPMPMGISISHPSVTAGTAGTLTSGGYILSNCHVLANSDSIQNKRAEKGDSIYQPGVADGGTEDDTIATLERWVKLDETGHNLVDCAIAKANSDMVTDEILGIGKIKGTADPKEGMSVKKCGRTTGVTTGEIIDTNATISVGYGIFTATFDDQIITGALAQGGDSGSLLLDDKNRAVALLFAGSSSLTAHNKISNVINKLGISLPGKFVKAAVPWIPFGLALGIGGIYQLYKRLK